MSNLSAQELGLKSIGKIQHNLSYEELFEQEKQNNEGAISANGTMMVDTGIGVDRLAYHVYQYVFHLFFPDKTIYTAPKPILIICISAAYL